MSPPNLVAIAACLLSLAFGGCISEAEQHTYACLNDNDCADGYRCVGTAAADYGICARPGSAPVEDVGLVTDTADTGDTAATDAASDSDLVSDARDARSDGSTGDTATSDADLTIVDLEPDAMDVAPGPFECTPAPCLRIGETRYDLEAGLLANVPVASGEVDVDQAGNDGWWYHYDDRTLFGVYAPLTTAELDGSLWTPMERVRGDDPVGWISTTGTAGIGERGVVTRADPGSTGEGGWVYVTAENSRHPVIEWRAPSAGQVTLALEVVARAHEQTDLEVHLIARRAEGGMSLDGAYVSADGSLDDNGSAPQPTSAATAEQPKQLLGWTVLDVGDSVAIYVRVGDDDAFDGVQIRGGVAFAPAP